MDALPIFLALAFTANKIVSTIKNLMHSTTRGAAVTQFLVWVVAIIIICVAAEAELTETFQLPGLSEPLGELDFASLALIGLMAGSTGSVIYDFKKSFDGTDSSAEPSLFPVATHTE